MLAEGGRGEADADGVVAELPGRAHDLHGAACRLDLSYEIHVPGLGVGEEVGVVVDAVGVGAVAGEDFGSFVAERFYLYQSRTAPTGSVYTKLAEFALAK